MGAIMRNTPAGLDNSGSGGGRNAQKINDDRASAARSTIDRLKAERQEILSGSRMNSPERQAKVDSIDRQIGRQQLRLKASENHSQRGKGY